MRIPRKLSRQQKTILKSLYLEKGSFNWPRYLQHVSSTSWFVANNLNTRHKDRIWNDAVQKQLILEDTLNKINALSDDKSNFLSEEKRDEANSLVSTTIFLGKIIDSYHRKTKRLTEKHRASFSRALKRLEDRGLIQRFVYLRKSYEGKRRKFSLQKGPGRTRYVMLTDAGIRVCRALFE